MKVRKKIAKRRLSLRLHSVVGKQQQGKKRKSLRTKLAERKAKREARLDYEEALAYGRRERQYTKGPVTCLTKDKLIQFHIVNHEVKWVRFKDQPETEKPSFHDFYNCYELHNSTYKALLEWEELIRCVQLVVEKDIHVPNAFMKYDTEDELGKDLYVYRQTDIKISPRLVITIGRNAEGDLDVVHVLMSDEDLKTDTAIRDLDFISSNIEQNARNFDVFDRKLKRGGWEHEKKEIETIQDRLHFYNCMIEEGQIEVVNGKVYIQDPSSVQTSTEEHVSIRKAREEINRRIRDAVPHR